MLHPFAVLSRNLQLPKASRLQRSMREFRVLGQTASLMKRGRNLVVLQNRHDPV